MWHLINGHLHLSITALSLPPIPQVKDELYLNLVLDFIPETVYRVARHYTKAKQSMPLLYVKVPRHTDVLDMGYCKQ